MNAPNLSKATAASLKGPNVTPETQAAIRKYVLSGRCDAIQLIFSPFRQRNRDVFALARAHGVGLIARTVLENGFLTGKYAPGHIFPEGDHRARWNGERLDNLLREAEQMAGLAVKPPCGNLAQATLRIVLDEADISTAIVGAKDAAQARANLAAADLPPLPAEVRNALARRYRDAAGLVNLPG